MAALPKRSIFPPMANPTPPPPQPPNPPKQVEPEPPTNILVIKGFWGLLLTCSGILSGVLGLVLHTVGDNAPASTQSVSSSPHSTFYLGKDLDLAKVHRCGYNCLYLGQYRLEVEELPRFDLTTKLKDSFPLQPLLLPWYTEITRGPEPFTLIGVVPKEEPSTRGKLRPFPDLPKNLTPITIRVVETNESNGRITFDNGKTHRVATPQELERFRYGTHWLIKTHPRDPELITSAENVVPAPFWANEPRFIPPIDIYDVSDLWVPDLPDYIPTTR